MEEIVVQLKDKAKAQMLSEFLMALDFVSSVKTSVEKPSKVPSKRQKKEEDFFALAGLWNNREVSLESRRKQAWPRQST